MNTTTEAFFQTPVTNSVQPEVSAFYPTVRKRVNAFLKEAGRTRFGGYRIWIKSVFMLAVYFVPFGLMLFDVVHTTGLSYLMWGIMGCGMAGLGLCVMHDANHGSFSKDRKMNEFVGYILNVLGGNSLNWKIQHNVLHHSFTNIEGHDEDISPLPVLRFNPHAKLRKIHRLQHIYAWFFYGLMTVSWIIGSKEFSQLVRFNKEGLLKGQDAKFPKEMTKLVISKLLYLFFMVILPIMVMSIAWYHIILGFLVMHFVAGLILACIFQPAHVMEQCEFPEPSNQESQVIEDWGAHQLKTTSNFGMGSRVFSWLVGGLNHQIEHHLFPNISHVHYPKIAKIVRETALEFNLPYNAQPTFLHALYYHGKMLHALGR